MEEKEIKNLIKNLNKKARQSSRKCLFKDCKEPAIESHLLQRRGIINQIAKNNHVWEIGQDIFKPDVFFFKNIGLKEAFSFFGFCSSHDDALFKEIEKVNIDFTNYRTQLLFSYRAIMNEMRKKQILIDFYDRILHSSTLRLNLSISYFENIKESKQGLLDGIKDEFYFEDFFLSNINDSEKRDFKFITFELPRIEICSSAVFTYETTAEINHMMMFESYNEDKPLTEIYFNFLPSNDKSIVIMGCLNERVDLCWSYIESFKSESLTKSLKKISDLLLCQVENWLCSDTLYQTNLKIKEKEIFKIIHESNNHPNERRVLDFDMFNDK